MKRSISVSFSALVLSFAASCAPPAADTGNTQGLSAGDKADDAAELAADPASPAYTDVEQYLIDTNDAGFTAWLGLRETLKAGFDDVCGDTFCEGDYTNLEPIRLRCSVNVQTGILKSCKYVFAGSYEEVNAATGSIKVTAKTFSCAVTVSQVSLADFMSTLTADGTEPAIRRPLPNGVRSIYDSLVGCL